MGNHKMMISDTFEIIHYDIYQHIRLYIICILYVYIVCVYMCVYLNTNYANLSPNLDFPLMKWF